MKIQLQEWLFLAILLGVFSCLVLATQFRKTADKGLWEQQKLNYTQALIEINVTGAVISPGVYKFPPGISTKEILEQAGLSKQADKKKINFKRKIFASSVLEVPEKEIVRSEKARIKKRNKNVSEPA